MTGQLARRYRRLLFAYPRAYRRARGDELVGALLDAAGSDRTRPSVREATNLVGHGLRARLGRPASRTVVAWAVLTTVVCGLLAAAFATRAGWETARPLPRTAEAQAMLAEILPDQKFTGIEDEPALFTIYGSPLGRSTVRELLLGDGGEYSQAGVAGSAPLPPMTDPAEIVDQARHNMRAHGWRVYRPIFQDLYGCTGPPCDPTTIPQSTIIVAGRGDTTFTLEVTPTDSYNPGRISGGFLRATPVAVYPLALAGGIAGALVAFLLFAWASRRTEGRHPARAMVKTLLGIALFLWWAPTLLAVPSMAWHTIDEPHPSWHPMWEWLGQPVFSLFFVLGCGSALLGLALAALPGRAPQRAHSPG
ncbi:hypothetical protein Ais01nite_01660 [Asanoa ishikariensis]|uniref:Uncharacterized protein n=1 Tax=Asanoa ishikariensis TaxID=137265 RepID=A0A1H3TP70_9ACTN|nr:hypothetical protein [Asanoa ishikariensis]GIF62131.1 hypothetical protein Ais01nite_01660 [Asanoa ishikariensis]SDZ51435.1 hypothetical protein SAMN05421684_6056 [Asanoa ishikariensis]